LRSGSHSEADKHNQHRMVAPLSSRQKGEGRLNI
jgi:hypothetical protein